MNVTLSDRHKEFIEEIARNKGLKRFKIECTEGSDKGDGYLGTITIITVEEISGSKELNVIIKSAQKGDELRSKAPVQWAYERENFLYGVIFKNFDELQKQYKVKEVFDGTAKYYGGLKEDNEECLVLENLRSSGFKLWNRKVPMDSNHVSLVMAQYGKFHALSYAMKKLKPEWFDENTKDLFGVFESKVDEEEMQESTISTMDRAFKAVYGNSSAILGLKRFMDGSKVFFRQTTKMKDKYSVILHGDCWCNNMMFKYDVSNSKIPSKVCLLDWQLSTVGNPVLDLAYFFYVCSSKFCMDSYSTYLKKYHCSLTDMLKQFGLDVGSIMTFEELQTQWRIYAKYGMYMSFLLTKILLADQNEAPDLRDVTQKRNNVMCMFDCPISNNEEYDKRISAVINHMVKNRFI